MEFMTSQRGSKLLIYQGNKYRKKRVMTDGNINWGCIKKNCPSKLRLDPAETQIICITGYHNHDVEPKLIRQIVNNSLKRAALENMDMKPSELVDKEIREKFPYLVDKLSDRDVKNIKKSIFRTRQNAKKGIFFNSAQMESFHYNVNVEEETCVSLDSSSCDSIIEVLPADPLDINPQTTQAAHRSKSKKTPKNETTSYQATLSNDPCSSYSPKHNNCPILLDNLGKSPLLPPLEMSNYGLPTEPYFNSRNEDYRSSLTTEIRDSTTCDPRSFDESCSSLKTDPDSGELNISSYLSISYQNNSDSSRGIPGNFSSLPEFAHVPQGSPSSTSPVPIAPKKAAAPPPPPPPQPSQPPEVCLRWNSYHSNMQATFPSLLNNEQFVDVTLACEGRSIKCHKVMLSACSSYFEELLSQNPCQHPIVFMRDLKFWEVQALVEFMYSGEVNVAQEKLPSLLAAAEALQIKGLTPSTAASTSNQEEEHSGGGGDTDEGSHPQPQKRVRKRKSAHPVAYPVRLQNTPPSPVGNQMSPMPMQSIQKIKVPMMSALPGTSHHREEPTSYHPPVRIKRERSSTPPLALSLKEEPLDLGMDNSERNKDENNGQTHNSTLQDAINRLHGKQQHHSVNQAPGLIKMESNGGLSEDDGSGSERSPAAQTDPGEGEV